MTACGVHMAAWPRVLAIGIVFAISFVNGCVSQGPQQAPKETSVDEAPYYRIGPGDVLDIRVWRNEELSRTVPVSPDGRVSVPLIENVQAAGKTPTDLAREMEKMLAIYVHDPLVTVMVAKFTGTFEQQIRVIGEAQKPQAIPYRENMTVLDVMIAVGGLTEFASGNRAVIVRTTGDNRHQYRVRLDDLIRDGQIDANVKVFPGDVLIIPQRYL